jgi:predicted dienelactone hydrolase
MPGEQASIDLSKVADAANRLKTNLEQGVALVQATEAASVTSALRAPLRGGWSREERRLSVDHRPQPLRLLVLRPTGNDLGRLAVISHGLWDDPESFEGWGELLAANGYTVLLPDHPGSNFSQQQSMLAGDSPPPGPEELRMRPLDVSALLDAVRDGRLLSGQSLDINSVAMIGHSWGATTSLQIAGFQPTENKLRTRCVDLNHPERNISWVLQCSWLSGVEQAAALDPRIQAVVAVSPPLRLLFDPTSSKKLLVSKVLLVSGTRDWVVPSGPEAITPMRETGAAQLGHRLVLVKDADHFNLRSFRGEERPALIGPVILAWLNEQLGVDSSVTFSGGGWGDTQGRLVDVSSSL